MNKRFFGVALLSAVVCCLASAAFADNWPRFRGPNATGASAENGVPAVWTNEDIAWQIDLPGKGHSSPVIWDDTVFVTSTNEGGTRTWLTALQASNGEQLWQQDYAMKPARMHPFNSPAASTPAVDANGVYVLWYAADRTLVSALSHGGDKRWTKEFGPVVQMHGASSSPAVYGDLLVFSLEQRENIDGRMSYWYALNPANGEIVWRLERQHGEEPASSSSPLLYQAADGTDQLVFSSKAYGIAAVDLKTGKEIWAADSALGKRAVSSPVQAGNLIVATCGRGSGPMELAAVAPPTDGSSKGRIVYSIIGGVAPYVPSPLAVNGRLFLFEDKGKVSCLDAQTGDVVWTERTRNKFFGSPVLIGDRIYCTDTRGKVVVIRAADTYELLGVNELGGPSNATPAIADSRMILRTESQLTCIVGGMSEQAAR